MVWRCVKNIQMMKIIRLISVVLLCCVANVAVAFDVSTYATRSELSDGRWVKVAVSESGMHFISASTLRKWGFSNPERVGVYGYGGKRISDVLTVENYVDDLPAVAVSADSRGVYFYADGPDDWAPAGRHFVRRHNPFSDCGYYFLTEREGEAVLVEEREEPRGEAVEDFVERLWHEVDAVSVSQSGHALFGEDFRFNSRRTFDFDLPGAVGDEPVWMRCSFVAVSSLPGVLSFSANGRDVEGGSTYIAATYGDNKGVAVNADRTFSVDGRRLSLTVDYRAGGSAKAAHLDAISINYKREISLDDGAIDFRTSAEGVALKGARARVWDVTNIQTPTEIRASVNSDGVMTWASEGERHYTAWRDGQVLPEPAFVGEVANQNLHGMSESPEMVIFTIADWREQAERIATLHRSGADAMTVAVVEQEQVFNEFASGVPDVGAFRRMLKMLYDRGGGQLKYALFVGRATFDNRVLTSSMKALGQKFMPTWQTDESLRDMATYTTDDIFAFLADGSGKDMASDRYCIAVGRIPVRTAAEARDYVDKLEEYMSGMAGMWKGNVLLVSDVGNDAAHIAQVERSVAAMRSDGMGRHLMYDKIHLDAFKLTGGKAEVGRTKMFKCLEEGVLWWQYNGHSTPTSLSGTSVLLYSDLVGLNLRRYPMFAGFTCEYMAWDGATMSGAEMLALNRRGAIGAFASTRKAYITNNGYLSDAVAREVFMTDAEGRVPTIGEAVMRAKNSLAEPGRSADANKLLYSLLGDPAMRLDVPMRTVELTTIDGDTVAADRQIEVKAHADVEMAGLVAKASGDKDMEFVGDVTLTLYDAETSRMTLTENYVYDEDGAMLYQGRDTVTGGDFKTRVAMPQEIADNFRPAAVQFYAVDRESGAEAIGVNRDFYVYGYDDTAEADTVAPTIEYAVINHEGFVSGAAVNESPVLLARVSDDVGINLSMAGIGHRMTVRVDGRISRDDVTMYYTPMATGTPGGTIAYPLGTLDEGAHELTLRVWDTSGNSAQQTLAFTVVPGLRPDLFDVLTDCSPATEQARFYLRHDRPDALLTVTIEVFDMMGRRVWSRSVTEHSDAGVTAPIVWNLTDVSGRRVPRGIYIYRATLNCNGAESRSKAKRIAVG